MSILIHDGFTYNKKAERCHACGSLTNFYREIWIKSLYICLCVKCNNEFFKYLDEKWVEIAGDLA